MIAAILIGLLGTCAGTLLLSVICALVNVYRHMSNTAAGT